MLIQYTYPNGDFAIVVDNRTDAELEYEVKTMYMLLNYLELNKGADLSKVAHDLKIDPEDLDYYLGAAKATSLSQGIIPWYVNQEDLEKFEIWKTGVPL